MTTAATTSRRDTGDLLLTPHRCRCRTCQACAGWMGTRLRMRMLAKADQFTRPALLSLTVDRDGHTVAPGAENAGGFASPREAHLYVTEKSRVARLMRLLGVTTWLWVLEFQTKTGDGWPHWHVLIDLGTCPGGDLDLRRAWSIWRDKWGIGGLDLSRPGKFSDASHAINYATKYLTKQPEGGYPVWVLESTRKVRFVGACRKLGAMVTGDDDDADPFHCSACDAQRADWCARCELCRRCCECESEPVEPLLNRMARCGQAAHVWAETVDEDTGEVSMRLAGILPAGVDEVADACNAFGLGVATTTDDVGRTSRRVTGAAVGDLWHHLGRHLGLHARSLWASHWQRVSRQRRKLLDANEFARRLAAGSNRRDLTRTV